MDCDVALDLEGDDCLESGSGLSHGSMGFVHVAPRIFHAELPATWRRNHVAIIPVSSTGRR